MDVIEKARACDQSEMSHDNKLSSNQLGMIKDIPVKVSVELGRKKLLIKDLMNLQLGSVIEFSENINDDLNIYVNDVLIAHGEFVLAQEKLAVRITEIVNTHESLSQFS